MLYSVLIGFRPYGPVVKQHHWVSLTDAASRTDDDVDVQMLNHVDCAESSFFAAAAYLSVLHTVTRPLSTHVSASEVTTL